MEDLDPIRNLRFQGFDIPQLLEWIGKIKDGDGAASMDRAAAALKECADIVTGLDDTLRRELGKLQIEWRGNAGSIAQEATAQQSAVMQQSQDPLAASASGVEGQGRGFEAAKNSLPEQSGLQHQQSENFFEWSGGAFGYTSDYDEEANQISGNKQAAQQALSNYRDTTVAQAGSFQPMPEMHAAAVSPQSFAPGPGGSGVGAFSAPGGGGSAGDAAGGSFGGGYSAGPGAGQPVPGGRSGTSPEDGDPSTGGLPDANPQDDPQQPGIGLGGAIGLGAGGAAVAGLGAAAAGRLLGGRSATPEGGARGGSGGSGGSGSGGSTGGRSGAARPGGSSGIGGGPGDTTAGKPAGGAGSRPGQGSMMGPAATRGQAGQDGDEEHQDRYFQAETPFDDTRLAAPPVFGQTAESEHEAADDRPDERKQD